MRDVITLPFRILRFVFYKAKSPLHRFFHWLSYERGKQSPYSFLFAGYQVVYEAGDGLVSHISRGYPYERDVLSAARSSVSDDSVVVDIGANIGIITLALARALPRAVFHCFEPSDYPFRCFRDTLIRNTLADRVILHKIALSDREGEAEFFVHTHPDALGDGLRDTHRAGRCTRVRVQTTLLDRYITRAHVGRVDLVKIDVEGGELAVLRGARWTLSHFRPVVLFEASRKNIPSYDISPRDIFRFFSDERYQVCSLNGRILDASAFERETMRSENFLARPF